MQDGRGLQPERVAVVHATQPGGYCTIQGCDETSCPEEAACIPLLPGAVLDRALRPVGERETGCMADEVCLDEGLCARQLTELRYCVKTCSTATIAATATSAGWQGRGGAWR